MRSKLKILLPTSYLIYAQIGFSLNQQTFINNIAKQLDNSAQVIIGKV